MHHKITMHSLILLTATLLTFLWVSDPTLSPYALQVSAVLLLTLLACKHVLKPVSFKLAESTIATITILLIVGTTGGIRSPLFFLNYLLLFSLSLLLEPIIPIILSGAIMAFYLLLTLPDGTSLQLVQLLAFPLMTPLSYLFGKLYQKVNNQNIQLHKLSEKVEELEEEIVEEEISKSVTQ